MAEAGQSYLEEQLNVVITKENHVVTYNFQRARLKLTNTLEIKPLIEIEPSIEKKIEVTDDEVTIACNIPLTFSFFVDIQQRKEKEKWLFSYQLARKVIGHTLKRFIPVISPENIVFDKSYTPYLLHYGVRDSLILFTYDEEQILLELKATICTAIEAKHTFEEYIKYFETLKMSEDAQNIMRLKSFNELLDYLVNKIHKIEENEKSFVTVSNKKWNLQRYILIGTIVCLVPTFIYTLYTLIFMIPKQEAYVESNRAFLERNYSKVITLLENYDPESMPYVVSYQLASSYIEMEPLNGEQRQNIENALTLQADKQFYYYWIYIGRGMSDQALTIARTFDDQDLVIYALVQYEDELKKNTKLKAEEKQELLDKITVELAEYNRTKELEQSETEDE